MISQPTSYGGWASGVSGYAVEPIAADKAQGFLPTGIARAQYFNWLHGLAGGWHQFLNEHRNSPQFGDGSDGFCVLDGSTIQFWAAGPSTVSSGVFNYTLGRSLFATTLRVDPGVELRVGGYPIFCQDELVATGINAKVSANGSTGGAAGVAAGAAGVASPTGVLGGGGAGGAGGAVGGNGAAGPTLTFALGGNGGSGISSTWGRVVAPAAQFGSVRAVAGGPLMGHIAGAGSVWPLFGGAGGGGGQGGSPSGCGGGGGGGGGVVAISARKLTTGATNLQARGGYGGAGSNAGDGGGGGGGGVVLVAYNEWGGATGVVLSATLMAPGGGGGAAGPSGHAGATGQVGSVYSFPL